jgi:tetratricopeptide (TPR) repeat protein
MKCSNCGNESRGNFCSACGAALRPSACAGCGASLTPGARFCTRCGTEAGAGAAAARTGRVGSGGARDSNLPWYIAGAVLLVLIAVLVAPLVMGGDSVPPRGAASLGGAAGTPGMLEGSPREQADQLFNRIMAAREQNDMETARFFAPMGVQAYESARPLDDDGLYHLAAIHVVGGNNDAAIATAEEILARNPDHLLALAVAAEAAEAAGQPDTARAYHERFVAAYNTEIGRNLPEYMDHARILPDYLEAARRALR